MHFSSLHPEVLTTRIVLLPFFTVKLSKRENYKLLQKRI